MNAPVMVELEGETDPLKIAMKELKLVTWCLCVWLGLGVFVVGDVYLNEVI